MKNSGQHTPHNEAVPSWLDLLVTHAKKRPYHDLEGYMGRWWIIAPNKILPFCARLHHVISSDFDRALHCHPWWNVSIILRGGFWEVMPHAPGGNREMGEARQNGLLALLDGATGSTAPKPLRAQLKACNVVWRGPGAIVFRRATDAHRLVLPKGHTSWSVFIMGRKAREWGFYPAETGYTFISKDEYDKKIPVPGKSDARSPTME